MKSLKIKNKKVLIIILVVCIVALLSILKFAFSNSETGKYGNRLDSIKKVKVSNKEKDSIKEAIEKEAKASDCSVNVQGKIINVIFTISDDGTVEEAKAISGKILEKLSDDIKSLYDVQVFIRKKDVKDSTDFPMIGYKNTKNNKFVW